ncbi:MAG: hypothetical protein Q4A41_05340, partial [Bacillota bacterium]|nr:hypothetical protein [Bacillota bacterium]
MALNWSLKEIYKGFDDPQIEKDFKALENLIKERDAELAKMSTDADFEKAMKNAEKSDMLFMKLRAFASLNQTTDTSNKHASAMRNRIAVLGTKTASFYPRFVNFIAAHKDIEKMIAGSKYLKEIAFPIRKIKKMSEHTLPEEMESMISKLKIDGSDSWENLFDLLTSTVEAELPNG